MASPTSSFAKDILPLFREKDISSMKRMFDLSSYDDVRKYATGILARLSAGTMPCDGAWPLEHVERFREWVQGGCQP